MIHEDIHAFVQCGYARLVAAVTLVTGSPATSEDVVQEAMVRAWERMERGTQISSLSGWVTTTAFNLARSRRRRFFAEQRALDRVGRRQRVDGAAAGGPEESTGGDWPELAMALADVSRGQREVVVAHYFLDLPVAEVAVAVGVSEGTVKTQLHRARAALRAVLETNARGDGGEAGEEAGHVHPR